MFLPNTSTLYGRGKKIGTLLLFCLLFGLFLYYQVLNTFSYNPYWGYDGGGHIDYIFSLAKDHHFPTIEKNYIAWHEPLYYLVDASVLKLILVFVTDYVLQLKLLVLLQTVWSALVLFLLYRISRNLLPIALSIITTALFFSLPSFHAASLFLTNELFAYLFAFLLSAVFIQRLRRGNFLPWDGLLFGTIIGLSLISKITTIVPVGVCLAICLMLWMKRFSGLNLRFFVLTGLTVILINLPWQIHRYNHIAQGPSLNNPSFLTPKPLTIPELLGNLSTFDTRVFSLPYFPMGSGNMWPMLYSDLVSDYYGILDNVDKRNATPKTELFQTADFSWVGPRHAWYMKKLIWLGIPLVGLMLAGLVEMIWQSLSKKRGMYRWIALYGLLLSTGYLAAQIFYMYRYPYFDMGAVKAIFILPGFFFPVLYGIEFFYRLACKNVLGKILLVIALIPLMAYITVSSVAFYLALI
ncbi:hypothetical protein KBD61_00675 [Patescibacteria group bacterium]|nr:hypothetical protein [Patescibacteria group bacterium]MBP9709521.1 hypothetical protein [Patescibacteria group bacterium]